MLTLVLSVIFAIVLLMVVVHFNINRCPDCHGKLVDNDYDENIGRVVWTCEKCGEKWILY
jgi:uncharacterized protein with PIN domain